MVLKGGSPASCSLSHFHMDGLAKKASSVLREFEKTIMSNGTGDVFGLMIGLENSCKKSFSNNLK